MHRSVLVTHCDKPSTLISSPPRSTPLCPRESLLFLILNFFVAGFSPLLKKVLFASRLSLCLCFLFAFFVVHSPSVCRVPCAASVHEPGVGAPRGRRGAHLCGADPHSCTGVAVALRSSTAHIKTRVGGERGDECNAPCFPFSRRLQVFLSPFCFWVLGPCFCRSICHKSGPAEAQGRGGKGER